MSTSDISQGSGAVLDERPQVRLSACMIVKNEEARLPRALRSVAFCDEVIVVDSGSTDRTVEVARSFGATVLEVPWRGFGGQRNVAMDAADGEWVLEVDADERITPELGQELRALVDGPPSDIDNAVIPCRHIFWGRPLGPSGMFPQRRTRLVRRDRYRHDENRTVHEGLWPAGRSAYPMGEMEHILSESFAESLADLRAYARLESHQAPGDDGLATRIRGVVVRPLVKFLYRAVLLGGWHDGLPGLAKITLDCSYDALTWINAFRSSTRSTPVPDALTSSNGRSSHFGRSYYGYTGPVRIVGFARGRRRAAIAAAWLQRAQALGADVALVTDAPPTDPGVRVAPVAGHGPVAFLRALSDEEQTNPIEVVMIPSRRGRRLSRLLPKQITGMIDPVGPDVAPADVSADVLARRPYSAPAPSSQPK